MKNYSFFENCLLFFNNFPPWTSLLELPANFDKMGVGQQKVSRVPTGVHNSGMKMPKDSVYMKIQFLQNNRHYFLVYIYQEH